MTSTAVDTKTVQRPTATGVFPNQQATMTALCQQIAAGVSEITIWGLTGTGKSMVTEKVRSHPRVQLCHDWEDAPLSIPGKVAILCRTGIPAWFAQGSAPKGEIFHEPFDLSSLSRIISPVKQDTSRGHVLQSRDERQPFLRELAACGLGSVSFVNTLRGLPTGTDPIAKLARLFLQECQSLGLDQALAVLGRLSVTRHENLLSECGAGTSEFFQKLESCIRENFVELCQGDNVPGCAICLGMAKRVFGTTPLTPTAQATVDFYLNLSTHVGHAQEPSFWLRSSRPVSSVEQLRICEGLLPLLRLVGLSPSSIKFSDHPVLQGWAGRKTGLYLFNGKAHVNGSSMTINTVATDTVAIDTERDLTPLFSKHDSQRASYPGLYLRHSTLIPKDTLIFGSGDHHLEMSPSAVALALELVLQKLGIPYQIARGQGRLTKDNKPCLFDFDGQHLNATNSNI